jgi:polysaccharide biosynthesis protein PslH
MKVLQLSNKIPYPEKDGGAIAINAVTEGLLKAGCDVKMLTMNTKKHFVEVDSIPEKFRNERHLEAVAIDTSVKPLAASWALFTGKSYNASRFESENFSEKLTEILQKEKFDAIQL